MPSNHEIDFDNDYDTESDYLYHNNVRRRKIGADALDNAGDFSTINMEYFDSHLDRLDAIIDMVGRDYEKQLWEGISERISDEIKGREYDSVRSWVEYLTDEDCIYPIWFKIYVMDGVSKMSNKFDKQRGIFAARLADHPPYPKLDPNALSRVYGAIADFYDLPSDDLTKRPDTAFEAIDRDAELKAMTESGNFNKLYSKMLLNSEEPVRVPEKTDDIHGEWIEYGFEDEEKIAHAAKGTPWCISDPKIVYGYLTHSGYRDDLEWDPTDAWWYEDDDKRPTNKSKFLIFHLNDGDDNPSDNSCAYIRLGPEGNVVEVAGIDEGQRLNDSLIPIVKEKVRTLRGGDEFWEYFTNEKRY